MWGGDKVLFLLFHYALALCFSLSLCHSFIYTCTQTHAQANVCTHTQMHINLQFPEHFYENAFFRPYLSICLSLSVATFLFHLFFFNFLFSLSNSPLFCLALLFLHNILSLSFSNSHSSTLAKIFCIRSFSVLIILYYFFHFSCFTLL